jgi:hypothetical protein
MKMFGFDTETPMGNLKVIATNEEYAEVETFEEVLDFITQKKYRASFFFLFNLSFDVNHILKLTGNRELLKELYTNKDPEGVRYDADTTLKYINRKLFKVCRKKHCVTFIDIATFYKGMSLNNAAKKYFGVAKDPIDGKKLGGERGYYETHRKEVLEYCQKDALLTLKLAQRMKDLIENCKMPKGKLSFRSPISSAKVAEIYVHDNYKYPKIPRGAVELFHYAANKAYHGGLFETFQRGVFEKKLYQYDINSAYPSEMQKLPHFANGRFEKVTKPDSGELGWYFCKFNSEWIPFNDFSKPYHVEFCYGSLTNCEDKLINPKRKVYPVGERFAWITKIEFEWLVKHKFPVTFIGGFEWFQKTSKYESPFAWIPEVYTYRQKIKDLGDPSEYALKIVLNGIYGKTAQFKKGMGRLTNFFYASYITAGTRLQVANVSYAYVRNLIEIATDSVLLDRKISLPISKKLGEWSLDEYRRGVLIGSGIHQFYDKEGFHTHARGLTDNPKWDMEKAMWEYKDNQYVWFTKPRPIQLGEMLMHTKALKFKDLGVFIDVSKKLSCNTDKKRKWEREYKNFGDFLLSPIQKSEPLEVKNGKIKT